MTIHAVRVVRNRTVALIAAVGAIVGLGASAHAGTILKLSLSETGPDVAMSSGVLATTDDGSAGTTGNQNTAIDFSGLMAFIPDVTTPTGSFTLGGMTATGPAAAFGTLAIQNFTGGTFSVYDPGNNLLLSGTLGGSALTGTIGAPATGSVFTSTVATATGGSLLGLIDPSTLSLSMDLINVNSGSGFSIVSNVLQPFTADGSVTIAADPGVGVPEPATLGVAVLGIGGMLLRRRRA